MMHPGLLLILGALPVLWLTPRLRALWMLLLPPLGLWLLWQLPEQGSLYLLFDLTVQPLRVDGLARIFASIFHVAALLSVIYALNLRDRMQQAAILVYAGAAVGGVLAGDLLTLLIFWELTGLSSVALIWARRSERAYRAGMRYLLVQVASGLLILAGIILRLNAGHGLGFEHLGLESPGGLLILLGIGIKCAFPVLHAWLQDTYPEATIVGTVVLSAFTTKLGIYALARGYAGTEVLVWVGAAMTCFPIFYAVIENDLRRVLAYSLINQLGFMVVGIGIGGALGVNGAAAHAVADILFKGLLFMSMGAVLLRAGTINGSELGGLYRSMPQTAALCMVGAASISAFPLFSGFVTKSMIMQAAAEEHRTVVWMMLLFVSAGVFHHAGIKIPYFAFFAHDSGIRCAEAPLNMRIAMAIAAALCIAIGCAPDLLYALLPLPVDYEPYTTPHVVNQLQLLVFSAIAFAVLMRSGIYPPELRSINLDADWLWRRALPVGGRALARQLAVVRDAALRGFDHPALEKRLRERRAGLVAATASTSTITWWALALLGLLLLIALPFS